MILDPKFNLTKTERVFDAMATLGEPKLDYQQAYLIAAQSLIHFEQIAGLREKRDES